MIRNDDVSGRLASCGGGQSTTRPIAMRMAPRACKTFHRIEIRRAVSVDFSSVFLSMGPTSGIQHNMVRSGAMVKWYPRYYSGGERVTALSTIGSVMMTVWRR